MKVNGEFIGTSEAAKALGLSRIHVINLCRRFGFPQYGNAYVIGPEEMKKLRQRSTKIGRPYKAS